jgi:hypothetical protein
MNKFKYIVFAATLGITHVACTVESAGVLGAKALTVEVIDVMWPKVKARLTNNTNDTVVLWDDWNSWGWYTFELVVHPQIKSSPPITIRRKEAGFTGNFASGRKLASKAHRDFTINVFDGTWDTPATLASLNDYDHITVSYTIPDTPEAHKYGALVGMWKSPPFPLKK